MMPRRPANVIPITAARPRPAEETGFKEHNGELVASYPSHQAAATHIGVSRITLSRWMQFLGVEVTNG